MDWIEILGLVAAFFTTIANIPQAVKVLKTRATKSLSAATYGLLFTGLVIWTIYGIMQEDFPVILGNAIGAILCGIILTVKLICKMRGIEKE